jgi:hypothetical protein
VRRHQIIYYFVLFNILLNFGCVKEEEPIETFDSYVNKIQPGDIIVANGANDTVVLLDEDGRYKDTIITGSTSAALSFPALAWDDLNKQVLISYDHTTATLDKITGVSLLDLQLSTVISNSNLTGTMPGVARLTNGELVVLEGTTTAEKFTSAGVRSGAPFMNATLIANTTDIAPMPSGDFVVCSSNAANTVRTYNSSGTLLNTATSVTPAPTLGAAVAASGCAVGPNGEIAIVFSGTTDGVRLFNSTLTTGTWNFIDTNVFVTPTKIAFKSNGNMLVLDTTFNHIVEISSTGSLVRTFGSDFLATPLAILVVP